MWRIGLLSFMKSFNELQIGDKIFRIHRCRPEIEECKIDVIRYQERRNYYYIGFLNSWGIRIPASKMSTQKIYQSHCIISTDREGLLKDLKGCIEKRKKKIIYSISEREKQIKMYTLKLEKLELLLLME